MLPQRIGRYRILDKIGSGGMAVVYLGQDETFGRQVAVKVLPTHLGQDPDNRERFRREAKAIATLEHAAVVPVYDYGEDGDQLFLVMRFMQGGSIKDRLSRGRLPAPAACAVMRRVASGLDKAHSLGMIHRDIKPGNILFDLEDNPYITDFGLVKLVESSVQLTHSEFFGTPAYTSPEQCQGEKTIDGRADVYSLAAVFYHMVTGCPPYESENAMALLMKHVSGPIPLLSSAAPDLPAAMQTVIDRGMAKEPADRYPTAGEMAKDAERILDAAPPAESLPLTESARPLSFDALRAPHAAPPAGDDSSTRRDSFAPGIYQDLQSGGRLEMPLDSEATNALDLRAIPTERRRLEWKPQSDSKPPPAAPNAPGQPHSSATTKPSAASYAQPLKPLEKKASGIPILIFIVVILAISLVYFALQKGLF
ncbi:MAG: serine/threonine protein kinase [Anaerolineales bacterium]|nr:serine/threonine protein kinase [Anaerolineales bacterium]